VADNRGGIRQGTPGRGYVNRTDLARNYGQPKPPVALSATVPQPQGEQPALADMLSQVPVRPDDVPDLGAPTNRPGEPVTAGLNLGPGPGREALGPLPAVAKDPTVDTLRALMLRSRNPDLVRMLYRLRREGRA
jgi:hypothetical protein